MRPMIAGVLLVVAVSADGVVSDGTVGEEETRNEEPLNG